MRLSKLTSIALTTVLSGWLLIGEFPQFLLGAPTVVGRYSVYGQTANAAQVRNTLEATERLLSNRMDPLPSSITLVLATPFAYSVFNPVFRNGFATTRPIGSVIWIREGSFEKNVAISGRTENNLRSLPSVIAHESMHVTLKANLGLMAWARLPSWLEEGYCEFVARETSYPFQAGVTRVLADGSATDASFRYFQYYAAVRYLIETEKKSFSDIVKHAEDYNYRNLAIQFSRHVNAEGAPQN